MSRPTLTASLLRELIEYDQETGVFHWRATRGAGKAGSAAGHISKGYLRIGINGERKLAHRLVWLYVFGEWPIQHLDHIDGDKRNNRLGNLRDAPHSINMQNKRSRSGNRAGLLGVTLHNGRWQSRIMVSGKPLNLGHFNDKYEAHASYIEAKRRLHPGNTQ